MKMAGIVLIMAGLITLIYGGILFTSQGRSAPGDTTLQQHRNPTIPYPPVVGLVGIVAGGSLLYLSMKRR